MCVDACLRIGMRIGMCTDLEACAMHISAHACVPALFCARLGVRACSCSCLCSSDSYDRWGSYIRGFSCSRVSGFACTRVQACSAAFWPLVLRPKCMSGTHAPYARLCTCRCTCLGSLCYGAVRAAGFGAGPGTNRQRGANTPSCNTPFLARTHARTHARARAHTQVTLHATVMCVASGTFVSVRSAGPSGDFFFGGEGPC